MNKTARGAICAAAALGVFAWGFFMGGCAAGRKRPPAPGGGNALARRSEGGEAAEQQRAFERLMRYSARDAYGLKEADENGR